MNNENDAPQDGDPAPTTVEDQQQGDEWTAELDRLALARLTDLVHAAMGAKA